LHDRPERNDAEVDNVAARLLVLRDHPFEGGVLLGDEPLGPPHMRGGGRRIGNIGPSERPGGRQRGRSTKQRTPVELAHPDLLAVPRAAGIASRSGALPWIIGRRLLFTGTNRRPSRLVFAEARPKNMVSSACLPTARRLPVRPAKTRHASLQSSLCKRTRCGRGGKAMHDRERYCATTSISRSKPGSTLKLRL